MKTLELIDLLTKVQAEHGNIEVIVIDPLGHLNLIEEDGQKMEENTDWTADFAVVTQPYNRAGEAPESVCLLIPHPERVIFGDDLRSETQLFTSH